MNRIEVHIPIYPQAIETPPIITIQTPLNSGSEKDNTSMDKERQSDNTAGKLR